MNIQHQNNKKTVRNLAIFTIVVLTIGWIGRGLDVLMNNPSTAGLGIILWIATPLVTSLLLRTFAGDGWKDFGLKPNLKGNLVWYLIAFLIYPITTAIILIIGNGFGWIAFPSASISSMGMMVQAFALALLPQFIKNIFEEFAWRGYLAPKVNSLRINDFLGHIIVGFIWGAWHITYYLFFLDRTILNEFTTLNVTAFIPLSILVMISWATMYGEIRLLTNSFWPAVLMHAVEDALLFTLIFDHRIQILPGTDWLISPMNGLINVFFFLLIGVGLRHLRLRKSLSLQRATLVRVSD